MRLALIDLLSGRQPGGHQEDYLASLEAALAPLAPVTEAPFLKAGAGGRWRRYRLTFAALLRAARGRPGIAVFHTPELRDLLCAAVVDRLVPPGALRLVVVLRREPSGMVGRTGWRAGLLEWLVRRLARSGRLVAVSDSALAARWWERRQVGPVALVPLPPRPDRGRAGTGGGPPGLQVGLLGVFRPEKGSRHYGLVIETVRRELPEAGILCQLPAREAGDGAAEALAARFAAEPAVRFLRGHLAPDDYDAALAACAIVVLPYDVASYGTGTSGVMHDAVAAGAIVVVTPIAWARDAYGGDSSGGGHPGVVWIAEPSAGAIAHGLRVAAARLAAGTANRQAGDAADFAGIWRRVILEAASSAS